MFSLLAALIFLITVSSFGVKMLLHDKNHFSFHIELIDSWVEMDSSSSDVDIREKIVLKRRLSQHFLGIFLPSLCIIIIAQVTQIKKQAGAELCQAQVKLGC